MIVDKLGNVVFVEMSIEEQRLMVRALRGCAANLSWVMGKGQTPDYVNKLQSRVKDLADCLEGGER